MIDSFKNSSTFTFSSLYHKIANYLNLRGKFSFIEFFHIREMEALDLDVKNSFWTLFVNLRF